MLTDGRREEGILRSSELLVVAFGFWVCTSILHFAAVRNNNFLNYNMGLRYERILLYIPPNIF
jgi:hypothetical protein